jgi:hypothetical protein
MAGQGLSPCPSHLMDFDLPHFVLGCVPLPRVLRSRGIEFSLSCVRCLGTHYYCYPTSRVRPGGRIHIVDIAVCCRADSTRALPVLDWQASFRGGLGFFGGVWWRRGWEVCVYVFTYVEGAWFDLGLLVLGVKIRWSTRDQVELV